MLFEYLFLKYCFFDEMYIYIYIYWRFYVYECSLCVLNSWTKTEIIFEYLFLKYRFLWNVYLYVYIRPIYNYIYWRFYIYVFVVLINSWKAPILDFIRFLLYAFFSVLKVNNFKLSWWFYIVCTWYEKCQLICIV